MKAAKYLILIYISGMLTTVGWMILSSVNIATCLDNIKPCVAAFQSLVWTALDWPYFWVYQLVGPEIEPFRLPTGLVPIAVLACAAGMTAHAHARTKRHRAAHLAETEKKPDAVHSEEKISYALEADHFQWFRDPGGRRNQSLQPLDI